MADYRWNNEPLQNMVQELIENKDFPEFEDLRQHTPVIMVGTIFYEDGDVFDAAMRKKIGSTPVRIKLAGNWVRSLTGGNGVLRGHNDNANGVDVVILVDPAAFNGFPEHAQRGHLYNVLSFLSLEKDTDEETGETVAKVKDGRPVWKLEQPARISAKTTMRFGAIDHHSAMVLKAGLEAQSKQLTMEALWKPEAPDTREAAAALDDVAPWNKDAPREIEESTPEGDA